MKFQNKRYQNLGKDNGDGVMECEGCMQPVMYFPRVQPSCNLQFIQKKLGFSFSFSLFFLRERAGASSGGFHPHCLPWAPPRGFHPGIFYSIFFFLCFSIFSFLCMFLLLFLLRLWVECRKGPAPLPTLIYLESQ